MHRTKIARDKSAQPKTDFFRGITAHPILPTKWAQNKANEQLPLALAERKPAKTEQNRKNKYANSPKVPDILLDRSTPRSCLAVSGPKKSSA